MSNKNRQNETPATEQPETVNTATEAGEQSAPAALISATAAALGMDPDVERHIPWIVAGFQLDPGSRMYDRKQGGQVVGQSLRVANVILRLKGSSDEAPFYFLGNINRITEGNRKIVQLSLPAQQKGAGSYAAAILKTDSAVGKAAQEAWKRAVLTGPFAKWIKEQDLQSFVKSTAAANVSGVEMDPLAGLAI